MVSKVASREDLLADTIDGMTGAEPESTLESDLYSCDVLDGNADHTIGMWSITWNTKPR